MVTRVESKGWEREQNEAHEMLASHGFKRISTSYDSRLGSDVDRYEHPGGHQADLVKFEDHAKWKHAYLVPYEKLDQTIGSFIRQGRLTISGKCSNHSGNSRQGGGREIRGWTYERQIGSS
jgi:hypothetical protein